MIPGSPVDTAGSYILRLLRGGRPGNGPMPVQAPAPAPAPTLAPQETVPPLDARPVPKVAPTSALLTRAEHIKNPFLKTLGTIGAGALNVADRLGSGLLPEFTALTPGTSLNTTLGNQGRLRNWERGQQLETQRLALKPPQEPRAQTVTSGDQAYQFNPQTGRYDIPIGTPKPEKPDNAEQQYIDDYMARNSGKTIQDAVKQYAADTEKPREPVAKNPMAGTVNGKLAYAYPSPDGKGFVDANTGKALTNFVPEPNYGQIAAGLRTVDVIDQDPNSPTYGMPVVKTLAGTREGVSATGAYGHEMAQAGAVQRAGGSLIDDIQANKGQLGTLAAWVKKYGLNTPIADPNLARLQAELGTFAALQPAMHGFRGSNAIQTFQNIIGGLQKNPDATIASIQGILSTSGAVLPGRGGAPQGGGAPRVGTVEGGYRFNGGDPANPKSWSKAK